MKFVDLVRVFVQAGRGGDGAVAWRREKYVPRGGPAGGDGGRGGSVVFVADPSLSTLLDLRFRQHLVAENGRPGGSRDKNGRSGEDLVVKVPVGTVVFVDASRSAAQRSDAGEHDGDDASEDEGELETVYVTDAGTFDHPPFAIDADEDDDSPFATPSRPVVPAGSVLGDLTTPGQRLVVAAGGQGGRGNIHFRSATNRAPEQSEPGTPGQSLWLRLELKLLADVGIVGFPNVGKSTFIARVSRARPKIAAYPFTTLVPQLGVVRVGEGRSMVVADVPGLIRGASEGRGLGLQFLRHLERTRVLLHLLAPDPEPGREPLADLDALEAELAQYGPGAEDPAWRGFEGRPRVVAINKVDTLQDPGGRRTIARLRHALAERNIPLFPISAHTGEGIPALLEALWRRLDTVRELEAQGE